MSGGFEKMHLENVCRLCLTDASEAGDMLPIFPIRGGNPNSPTSVVHRILQCTSLRLEQTEGVPATICELCSVRLEDWYAFREQCIGSDEYLRVTLRHAFYPDEIQTSASPPPPVSITPPSNNTPTKNQLNRTAPSILDSALSGKVHESPSPPKRVTSKTPPPTSSSSSSSSTLSRLAKRRQSTFEWPVSDGKGNNTGQKITVEVLGVCSPDKVPSGPTIAELIGQDPPHTPPPSSDTLLLEQASWSKEYCARVNNLMVMVNGSRPFKCKICRRMFNNRNNLRRHIKSLHGDEILEGESPPPEAYGYGHIDRVGPIVTPSLELSAATTSPATAAAPAATTTEMARPPTAKKKRKSTDPPITGPYQCEVCPRSFKMPAHLAVHRKTHRQIEFEQSELLAAIEQQKGQQPHRERSSSSVSSEVVERVRKTTIDSSSATMEPGDVIQLSDDEEDEVVTEKKAISAPSYSVNDDLDDGFDEEEGSLKETSSLESVIRPDPSALAIVEIGAEDNDDVVETVGPTKVEKQRPSAKNDDDDDDEDVVVVQEDKKEDDDVIISVPASSVSKKKPESSKKSNPPGPLSYKLKYTSQQSSSKTKPTTTSTAAATPSPSSSTSSASSSSTLSSVHRCHLCRHTFPREDLLREHQKSHQHDTPCAYRCGWCKKGFRYRQNYTMHLDKQTCRLMNANQAPRGMLQPQQAGRCT